MDGAAGDDGNIGESDVRGCVAERHGRLEIDALEVQICARRGASDRGHRFPQVEGGPLTHLLDLDTKTGGGRSKL